MQSSSTTITGADGAQLFVYQWAPDGAPKAIVQISHGMAEHAARYERLATALTAAGYVVYANDHRGHGRTAGDLDKVGYFADKLGFEAVVDDLYAVTRLAQAAHPGLPVFILGHSMGSMLARAYVMDHGEKVAGLVLSGTGGDPGPIRKVGETLARLEGRLRGPRTRSKILDRLTFGSFNKAFAPNRTGFDWLSRDNDEVDKYVADDYCGAVFTAGFFSDLLRGIGKINDPGNVARIRADLPVFLVSGALDPVGGQGKGVRAVAAQFRAAGLRDVSVVLYPEARHEILNETNRDEVTGDIVDWLDEHLPTAS